MIRGARVMRRRRLLRAAAVGGVAYKAGKHTDRKRDDEAAQQAQIDELGSRVTAQAAPAPASTRAAAPDMPSKLKMLDELGGLHERGVLSDEEFAQQKQRVLEG